MSRPFYRCAAALLALGLLAGCASQSPEPAPQPKAPTPEEAAAGTEQQLLQNAQRGDLDSQFKLGSHFFVGQPQKDLKQAEYWWKQAADRGHAMAAVSLAYLYTGRDAPEMANTQQMLRYLRQSAAAGNPMAQHVLGSLYLRGEAGLRREPDQAKRLYVSACKQRYEPSCKALKNF